MITTFKCSYDVQCSDRGSIVLLRPVSAMAARWFNTGVITESWQWIGGQVGVDRKYAATVLMALEDEGFKIQYV